MNKNEIMETISEAMDTAEKRHCSLFLTMDCFPDGDIDLNLDYSWDCDSEEDEDDEYEEQPRLIDAIDSVVRGFEEAVREVFKREEK